MMAKVNSKEYGNEQGETADVKMPSLPVQNAAVLYSNQQLIGLGSLTEEVGHK